MAKRRTIIDEETPDTGTARSAAAPDATDLLGPMAGDEELLSSIVQEYGVAGRCKIKVYRQGDKGDVYCYATDEAPDEDSIRAQFGGGAYKLKVFVDGVMRRLVSLNIADRLGVIPGGIPNAAPFPASVDPVVSALQSHIAVLTNILSKNGQGSPTPTTPMAELAEAMKTLHGLSAAPVQESNTEKMIDVFLRGMEMGKTTGGNGEMDWKSMLIDAVRTIGPQLLERLPVTGANAAQLPKTAPDAIEHPAINLIREGIKFLKTKAISGADASVYSDFVLASADDARAQAIISAVLNSSFEDFAKIDADMLNEPYKTWFGEIYKDIRDAYQNSEAVKAAQ